MKRNHLKTISIGLLVATTMQAQVVVQNWDFNDSANTQLDDTSNSGSLGTTWDFRLQNPDQGLADGLGSFVIGENTNTSAVNVDTDSTRKASFFADTISSGTFTFEYHISGWDLAATDAIADATNGQEGITFKLNMDNTNDFQLNLEFELGGNGGAVRTRHSLKGLGGSAAQANLSLASSTGVTVRVQGDLDTGFFTTSYDSGSGFNDIITDGTGLTAIGEIILAVEGTDPWASGDFVAVDYVSLTSVPEPSTYALLTGFVCLAFITIRRRLRN